MKKWVALALASIAFSPAVLAATSQTTKNTTSSSDEIADLKKRIEALEKEDVTTTRSLGVGTKEVFGIGSDQYNEVLYINDFGVNTDLNLLHQRRFVHGYFGGFDKAPRLMFSGNISGTVGVHSNPLPIDSGEGKQFAKAEAEIDMVGFANEDWLAYIELIANAYGEDTDLGIEQGFVTYGNFDKTPIYLTMGYQYIPFGSFTTSFITNTLVRDVSRTQTPAATAGYVFTKDQLNFNMSAFLFDGSVQTSDESRLDEFGVNAQIRNEKLGPQKDIAFTVGASVINNIASSNGIDGYVVDETLNHYVPAVDVRFQLEKGSFTFLSEYVQATSGFSKEDFTQTEAGHSAKHVAPEAAHFEASYSFPVGDLPTELSLAYDQALDTLAFEIPHEQYGASYQLTPFRNTYVTLEYLHKVDYGTEYTTTAGDEAGASGTGKHDNEVQMQVNVYF